jgi:methionine sulfoxide reductase heme-binding subunit
VAAILQDAMVNATPHLFWITSRAAGIAALVLASLSVSFGLLMATKLMRRRGPDLIVFHEILSLSTIAAIVIHGVSLLGDQFLHPSIVDIAVPFTSGYKTVWTATGIIAGWALALLGLCYYSRRLIGSARWRNLHRLTILAWAAGLIHAVGEGTDAGQIWFLAMIGLVAVPAVALVLVRYLRHEAPRPGSDAPGRAGAPAPRPVAPGPSAPGPGRRGARVTLPVPGRGDRRPGDPSAPVRHDPAPLWSGRLQAGRVHDHEA